MHYSETYRNLIFYIGNIQNLRRMSSMFYARTQEISPTQEEIQVEK